MKRVTSIFLVLAIFLTLAPMSVFAHGEMDVAENLDDVHNMSSEEYAEWKKDYIASQEVSQMSEDEISLYASNVGYIRNGYIEAYINESGHYTIGTVAGDPNSTTDNNKILLYGHPDASTTETLIRIDGVDYFFNSNNSTFSSDGTKCVSTKVIDGVLVTQTISLVYNSETSRTDTVEIKYDLTNNSTVAKEIGGRIMLDTMLGSNDGAPFKIPGKGDITTECEYAGDQIPQYWQSFDNFTNPTVIATGTFYKTLSQRPDKVQFAYWGDISGAAWNYRVDPYDTVTRDSAVAVYYNPITVAAGATRSFCTYYGLSNLTEEETVGEVSYRLSGTKSEFQLNDEGTAYIGNPFTLTMYIQNTTSSSKEVDVTLNIPSELMLNDVNDSLATELTVGSSEVLSVKWELWAQPQYTSKTVEYSVSVVVDGEETTETYSLVLPAVVVCDVNGHSYGDWYTISEPTCTTSGLEYHTCQRAGCGYEETNVLQPLGHDYSDGWIVDTEPTCTTEGSKSRHCSKCTAIADVTVIEPLGHKYGDWIVENEPTILTEGSRIRICTDCGYEEREVLPKLQVDPEELPTITVSKSTVRVGDTVSVDISVKNNPGIAAMNLMLHYDNEYMTLTEVKDGEILGATLHSDDLTLNPYILTWANDTAVENITANGIIATLTFNVSEDAPLDSYPVWVSYDNDEHDIFNVNLDTVDFETIAGSIIAFNYTVGDVNDDRNVNSLDRAILSRYLSKWLGYDTLNTKAADVNCDDFVNALDRAILTRHLAGWLGYETLSYGIWIDSTTYTRAEWIDILLDKIGAEVSENDGKTNYYGDTEGHEYENDIEAAKAYGIIPAIEDEQDVPLFNPDDIADREFAAITSVLAMGFVYNTDDDIICQDKDSLMYPEIASVAIKEGFISLENGCFNPNRAVSASEKNKIFSTIDRINESVIITEDIQNVSYSSDVIVETLKNITDYTIVVNGDDSYSVIIVSCPEVEAIQSGDYFVLPANDNHISGIALRAIDVGTVSNGYLTIEAVKPEDISKIMSNIVFSGEATADVDGVQVLDENITYSYDPEGVIENEDEVTLSASIGGSFAVPGKWTFDFGDGVKIGEHAKLKGKAEVTIPNITAYLDADFDWFSVDVNELTVSITEKAKIIGEFEYVFAESMQNEFYSGAKEFARVPFALGTTGLSIDLVFSLYYDVKGNISIVYTVEATQGLQYKNDSFRFIHNFNNDLDIPNIEFSGQVGIQPAINLVFCEIWDIIGISGKIGAAATASMENHIDENLCCVDGTVYLSASIALNQDTLVGGFLKDYKNYTLEKEIYNKDNSPLKLKLHFENLQKVPECTYGQGKIEGYVYDANTREPIRYARISIFKGDDLKAIKYTNSEGKYTVDSGLPVGDITIKISATGYQTYSDTRPVNKNVVTYIESYMMVGRGESGQGNVSGRFINALTGDSIAGITYEIRSGWNNITGDVLISSSSEGSYNIDVAAGNYTILAKADNYIPSSVNITVTENSCVQADITLSPEDSGSIDTNTNLRFVLTWGANPSDLDSHLFGPNANGSGIFHTYYSNKDYYSGGLIANLDLDDTSSYGPETTTIYKMNTSGIYSFYVHDYSNRSSNTSKALSNSDAKIVIYNGNTQYATFSVPTNVGGTVWHVFDYDAATGTITPVNTMSYSSDPGDLDLYSNHTEQISEQAAIRRIIEAANQAKSE